MHSHFWNPIQVSQIICVHNSHFDLSMPFVIPTSMLHLWNKHWQNNYGFYCFTINSCTEYPNWKVQHSHSSETSMLYNKWNVLLYFILTFSTHYHFHFCLHPPVHTPHALCCLASLQYAIEKQVFINKFQIPQFTRRGEPKWFSGLITLFLLVARGLTLGELSLIVHSALWIHSTFSDKCSYNKHSHHTNKQTNKQKHTNKHKKCLYDPCSFRTPASFHRS
jgi:hypothetical protein